MKNKIGIKVLIYLCILILYISIVVANYSFKKENLGDVKWPTLQYKYITSYYGYRTHPIYGYKMYHNGIDIGAPKGAKIVSVTDGKVIRTGWYGGYGYSISIQKDEYIFLYGHIDPNIIVNVGDYITKGDVIAYVGPKNVYGVINNRYKDELGNPTNGSTTGPHLHLTVFFNNKTIDPLIIFEKLKGEN